MPFHILWPPIIDLQEMIQDTLRDFKALLAAGIEENKATALAIRIHEDLQRTYREDENNGSDGEQRKSFGERKISQMAEVKVDAAWSGGAARCGGTANGETREIKATTLSAMADVAEQEGTVDRGVIGVTQKTSGVDRGVIGVTQKTSGVDLHSTSLHNSKLSTDDLKILIESGYSTEEVLQALTANTKKSNPSYAQAVRGSADPPVGFTKMTVPKREDGKIKVFVDDEEYRRGLAKNENCVLGRLFVQDGYPSLSTQELKKRLMKLWGIDFKLLLLGKGFYHIQTISPQDHLQIRKQSVYDLKPGIFRTYKWQHDFNPFGQNITTTQVWIRIHSLPLEYWGPTTLNNIALGVGTPIRIEEDYKHALYVRILVDVDLADPLPNELYVTKKDNSEFCVRVEYERLPSFCEVCNVIGHSRMDCKKLERKRTSTKIQQEKIHLSNVQVVQKEVKEGNADKGSAENLEGVIRNTVINVMKDCVRTCIVDDLISNSGKKGNSTTGDQNKEAEGENKLDVSKVRGGKKDSNGKSSKQKNASEVPLSNIWEKLNDVVEPVVNGKDGGSKGKGNSKSPEKTVIKKILFQVKLVRKDIMLSKNLGQMEVFMTLQHVSSLNLP